MNNTQVQLSNSKVLLLSIPREDYWIFSSGILQLLNKSVEHGESSDSDSENDSENSSLSEWSASSKVNMDSLMESSVNELNLMKIDNKNSDDEEEVVDEDDDGFYHVAFTPSECTIIFSEKYLLLFDSALAVSRQLKKDIKLFPDSFYLLEIAGDGLNIGKRVLEITEPLSQGGISLFFLSNYFSDIVLIPCFARDRVVSLLEQKGFSFANSIKSYNGSLRSSESTLMEKDVFEEFDIRPKISSSVKLVLTGARSTDNRVILEKTILALASNSPNGDNFPKFFSITKTLQDEILLLLPKNFGKYFGFQKRNLVGSLDELMIPINIDLFKLPIDSKGIVSGIAKKVIKKFDLIGDENCEMSYLSMGRSSIVMIPIENLDIVKAAFAH